MGNIQREFETGSAEKARACKASNDDWANPNSIPDIRQIEVAGLRLPPPGVMRWSTHRKAAVVAAVRGGILSLDQARERYALSLEEYLTWQQRIDLFGLAGLRVNETQQRLRPRPGATA